MVFRSFGPRHPAAVVSASGSFSSRLSYGKLAMPIMTAALKWSAELLSEWKSLSCGAQSFLSLFISSLIYFCLASPPSPWCCAFMLFKCHFFPPLITSSCIWNENAQWRQIKYIWFIWKWASESHICKHHGAIFWVFVMTCGRCGRRNVWKKWGQTTALTDERHKTLRYPTKTCTQLLHQIKL